MGSQLNKNYEVQKSPFSSTGLGHCWQLFNAVKRDKVHSPVTIFYLEKKKIPKANLESCLSILKQEPANLAKLKHPFILKLLELPIQDQKIIAFATQPIECTLADLFTNITRRGEIVPSQLQLKSNLMELCNAIGFLHQTARTIHNCLNLDHIFFTKDGKLKLGGFYFSKQSTSQTDSIDIDLDFTPQPKNCPIMLPDLRFTAPEIVKNNKCSMMSDLFSLGCVLYSAASLRTSVNHQPYFLDLLEYQSQRNKSAYLAELKKFEASNQSLTNSQLSKYLANDVQLKNLLVKLLSITYPQNRGRITDIATEQWFQDPFLKTLNYLQHLSQKENSQKVQFLNGMQRIISKFEPSVTRRRIIPRLTERIQLQPQLSVNIIPIFLNILQQSLPEDIRQKIVKQNSTQSASSDHISNSIQSMNKKQKETSKKQQIITPQIFIDQIFPTFTKLCKGSQMPAQTMFLLIRHTQIWLYYLKNDIKTFQNILFPLHLKGIDCRVNKLVETSLKQIHLIAKKINAMTLKSQILPRLLSVAAGSQSLDLQCLAMKCIRDITPILDKRTLTDTVLDGMMKMAKKITDGKICLMVIEICDQLGKTLGAQTLGYKILPLLIPMILSSNLTKDEFNKFINDIAGHELREKQRAQESQKIENKDQNKERDNQFGFLDAIDGNKQRSSQTPAVKETQKQMDKNSMDDFFASMNLKQPSKSQATVTPSASNFMDDPFASLNQRANVGSSQQEKKGGLVLKKQSGGGGGSLFDNMDISKNNNFNTSNKPPADSFFQTNFSNNYKQQDKKQEDPFAFLTQNTQKASDNNSKSSFSSSNNIGGFDMFSNPFQGFGQQVSSSMSLQSNTNPPSSFGMTNNSLSSNNTISFTNQNPTINFQNMTSTNPFDALVMNSNSQNTPATTQTNFNNTGSIDMFNQQNLPGGNSSSIGNNGTLGFQQPQTTNFNAMTPSVFNYNNNNNINSNSQNLFSQQNDAVGTDLFAQLNTATNRNTSSNNLFQNNNNIGFFQQQQPQKALKQQQQSQQQNPFPNFFN